MAERQPSWQTERVPEPTGPILIVVALLVVIPVGVLMSMGIVAAIFGTVVKKDVDSNFEGSEYLELGK